ncbi:MAG: hypothetical protein IJ253_03730 [Bacteroidaceae bacterium]|nr:hypothetical protein [Bacteroidaceae bacterium]
MTEFFVWRQWAGNASYVNCYYTEAKGTEGAGNATLIDAAAVASGELCFRLNGDQSKIVYTQTLGEDEIPYPSTSHKQVYSTAALNCGGQPSGETSYSNTGTITELPPHTYDGGFRCQVCGHVIEDYVTAVDGFYPLGTSQELGWFAYKVNSGGTSMNARLTADIDWTDFNMMIGTDGRDYQGTFDGQGHTITLAIDHQADGTGFFSHIGARGRVCNLILDGTITGTTGIGSFAWETWGVVENCVSRVTLRSLTKDFSSSYTGGLACATHDRAVFRNCLFEGALEGEEACGFAGFFYFNNLGSPTLENCVFAPREVAVVASGNYTLTFEGATVNNCFCTYDFGDLNGQCKLVDAETMASGSVAWQLNGGRVDSPAWTQTLGEDPAPTPVGGHGVVYMVDETTYMSVLDVTELAGLQNAISDMETERLADIVATRQLTDDFEALLNTLQGAADIADFNTAYKQWREDRKMLDENIAAWADYVAYVGEMKAFMKGRDGQSGAAQRLLFYLEDYEEPGDEFPNGTAEYILEACQLGTEGIRAERAFLTGLYNAVLASDYDRDMDITDLLVNPDFGQRGLGWSGQGASDYDTSRPVAECYNTSFNMTQTLTDLKPGIYEVRINGYFRPAGENGSRFYTAFLSAGDQQVPLMHSVVDAIAAADAVDMENCYITQLTGAYPYDEFYNTDYYIPGSMLGASYAFKGGRYVNRILAHVTDGTLQIGIRSDGTGSDKDWTVFANTRLYYRGTMDEAAETLAAVLEGQAARAGEILEGEVSDMEFARFPNFSKTLRDEMQAAIEAAGSVTDPAGMYALTERFSRLFAEVEDCQKAYVALMGRCYSLTDIYGELSTCGALTTEEYQQKINDILNIYDGWGAGAYSAAEAREMAEGMLVLPMEDDYYLISDATSLLIFAALVNQGQTAINAKVTADITEGISVIIGTGGKDYQGTFDGQGHKITLAIDHQSDGTGFFSHIGVRGRVRNLVLDGTISGTTGIGSFAWESWGTLENCVSLVAIRSTATGNANSAGITCASREGATYRNCVFAGTIDCGDATNVAGFNWWANGGQPIYENCLCVPGSVTAGGYSAWSQQPENGVYKDCYYTDVAGTNNAGNARLTEKETLAGGEICYRFNGDQTTIRWTQTLGEDLFPYPFTTHSQVYPTTALNCGGQPIGDEFGYSNTPHTSELPPHTFVGDGFVCTVCGKLDEHYCEQQDGFYLIATARQMDWLAAMINGGRADICARLTADIDWSASSIVMGTGGNVNLQFMDGRASENDYQGTLDGAGHRLTVNIDHQSGGTGIFAHIGANGKVCNILIDGTISGTTGVGTFAWENWGTLENCVSLATLRTSCNGFAAMGGMTCASHGQAVYRNCLFAGRMLGEAATNTSGFNWSENGGNPVYENCASIPAEVGVAECFVWRQWAGNASYVNCYYTEAKGTEGAGDATLIDAAAVASGELCFRLNGDQSKIVYTQTLGEDEIPYPFGTRLKVVLNDDGTYGNDASGIASPTDGEMRNGTWYDVSGRRVERPVKGLYIRDGKVWMIK